VIFGMLFSDVTPYGLVSVYQRFEGTCCSISSNTEFLTFKVIFTGEGNGVRLGEFGKY